MTPILQKIQLPPGRAPLLSPHVAMWLLGWTDIQLRVAIQRGLVLAYDISVLGRAPRTYRVRWDSVSFLLEFERPAAASALEFAPRSPSAFSGKWREISNGLAEIWDRPLRPIAEHRKIVTIGTLTRWMNSGYTHVEELARAKAIETVGGVQRGPGSGYKFLVASIEKFFASRLCTPEFLEAPSGPSVALSNRQIVIGRSCSGRGTP